MGDRRKGAFSEQTYEVNGKPWSSGAAHIFRARPDRTGIEPVLTGGMDNPVSVAFLPKANAFCAEHFLNRKFPVVATESFTRFTAAFTGNAMLSWKATNAPAI
jgi:hypothetical protein